MTSAPSPFRVSPARQGVDWLLRTFPHLELVRAEWQRELGPWLLVELGQQSATGEAFARHPYAVFKRTGAVHGMEDGAVLDPPLFTP